jgi:hypothetical protein
MLLLVGSCRKRKLTEDSTAIQSVATAGSTAEALANDSRGSMVGQKLRQRHGQQGARFSPSIGSKTTNTSEGEA